MSLSRGWLKYFAIAWCAVLGATPIYAQTYKVATVAKLGDNGDNGPATKASLLLPRGIAVGRDGTIYVSQVSAHRVRKITQAGIISTYAGTGDAGFFGDGGLASSAKLNSPADLALDQKGNLYVLDQGNGRVRRIDTDGNIQTVAGQGGCGPNTNNMPAIKLQFCTIAGIALDPSGDLYVSEEDGTTQTVGHRVWHVSPSGNATIFAGPGSSAPGLTSPTCIAFDPSGNLYICDLAYIYRRNTSGTLATIAGSLFTNLDHVQLGAAASGAYLFGGVTALATDATGNLYFALGFSGQPSAVYEIQNGIMRLAAGVNQINSGGFDGDQGSLLFLPGGLSFGPDGTLYISEYYNSRISRILPSGVRTTIAGSRALPSGSMAPAFALGSASAIAAAADGALYYADGPFAQIRKIAPSGQVSLVAGNGLTVFSGDGGLATNAGLGASLNTIALDPGGNLYFHSYDTFRVREISSDGLVNTVAGNGLRQQPVGEAASVAADASGNVYFSDQFGLHRWTATGTVTINQTQGAGALAVNPAGVLHFVLGQMVYRLQPDGAFVVVAGTSTPKPGLINDGLPATQAFLPFPGPIAFDPAGNLYIGGTVTSGGPGAVWRIGADGIQRRIAGPAAGPYSPDGTAAAGAAFPAPFGISADGFGKVFLTSGSQVRVLAPDSGSGCSIRVSTNTIGSGQNGGDFPVNITASAYLCPWAVTTDATWIHASVPGSSGTGPVTLHVDANTGGARQATVSIGGNSVVVSQPGAVVIAALVNAASNAPGPISPGELVVLYGTAMGPPQLTPLTALNSAGLVGTTLAGASVSFDGIEAPLVYVSATQVAAVVPYEVSNPNPAVTVQFGGGTSAAFTATLAAAAPALFTADASGKGQAAALNQDGSANSGDNPASAGDIVTLYATGEGQTSPPGVDGKPAVVPLPMPLLPVTVTIGGVPADVSYAGAAPSEVAGVMQLNVCVPVGVAGGAASVLLQVGDFVSPAGVTLAMH